MSETTPATRLYVRRLDGPVAMVTVAAHGIDAAYAHRIAGEGAAVAVADLDADSAEGVGAGPPCVSQPVCVPG